MWRLGRLIRSTCICAFFIRADPLGVLFLRPTFQTLASGRLWSAIMDLVFLGGIGLLWLLMVLLVAGFRRLEKPQGGRP